MWLQVLNKRCASTAFDKNSLFDGASIGRVEFCVKEKVSQDLVCEIHKVIRRLEKKKIKGDIFTF